MTWEINSTEQLVTTLLSLAVGVFLSFIYDIFKSFRLCSKKGKAAIFFEDIVFGLIATLVCFCLLMLRTKGQVRLYVLLFLGLGFVLWRLTLSKFFIKILLAVLRFLKSVLHSLKVVFSKFAKKVAAKAKKFHKSAKKGLKGVKRLLYNQVSKYRSAKAPNEDMTG